MKNKWKVIAYMRIRGETRQINLPDEHISFGYKFINGEGQTYQIKMRDNGRLSIRVGGELIIFPNASNDCEIGEE